MKLRCHGIFLLMRYGSGGSDLLRFRHSLFVSLLPSALIRPLCDLRHTQGIGVPPLSIAYQPLEVCRQDVRSAYEVCKRNVSGNATPPGAYHPCGRQARGDRIPGAARCAWRQRALYSSASPGDFGRRRPHTGVWDAIRGQSQTSTNTKTHGASCACTAPTSI